MAVYRVKKTSVTQGIWEDFFKGQKKTCTTLARRRGFLTSQPCRRAAARGKRQKQARGDMGDIENLKFYKCLDPECRLADRVVFATRQTRKTHDNTRAHAALWCTTWCKPLSIVTHIYM